MYSLELLCIYPQWAAVIIHVLLAMLHPQMCLSLSCRLHCHGHECGRTSVPLMMRLLCGRTPHKIFADDRCPETVYKPLSEYRRRYCQCTFQLYTLSCIHRISRNNF